MGLESRVDSINHCFDYPSSCSYTAGVHNEVISVTEAKEVPSFVGRPKPVAARHVGQQGVVTVVESTIYRVAGRGDSRYAKNIVGGACAKGCNHRHFAATKTVGINGGA